jgi:hypothetical protein
MRGGGDGEWTWASGREDWEWELNEGREKREERGFVDDG